jgi:hypothetical protein
MATRDGLAFPLHCRFERLPEPIAEYAFAQDAGRRWRFDFAWPPYQVALEVEGGIWTQGRHARGAGFTKDLEKYNDAQVRGWIVLRCLPRTLATPATLDLVRRALAAREERLCLT